MVGMVIDNVRLPEAVERGAEGGPEFRTTLISLDSGHEHANINWEQARGTWQVGYGIDGPEMWAEVVAFLRARRGKARGFLFKDWSDYQIPDVNYGAEIQSIGTGDGVETDFRLFKRYPDTVLPFDRTITRPVEDTLKVYLNGVETAAWTLVTGGIVRLTSPAALDVDVAVSCEFDAPVRFDVDLMKVNLVWKGAASVPVFTIREVRV